MPLSPGDRAPALTLPSTDGRPVALAELWRERPLVVLFFPLAFTSTCTTEMCSVRDDRESYAELDAQVVAVSVDSPASLNRFRADLGAEHAFLSDFNREASQAFGVLREGPLGPGLMGVSDRAAFVIGRDGVVRYAWHSANPGLLPPFDEIKRVLEGERTAA